MSENIRSKPLAIMLTCVALLQSDSLLAAPVAVRHTEGLVHGFLLLSTTEGKPLADGDLIQVYRSNRVISHLVFRFKDGSVHDETAIFSQRGNFRLLSYHRFRGARRSSIRWKSRSTLPHARLRFVIPMTTARRRPQPTECNCRRTLLTA